MTNKKKTVVALLTGRGNSTLLNKNILPVLGKPLLYYPAMAAKSCEIVTDFYVSSNDEKILKAGENCGYKRIVRPEQFSTPEAQHKDVIIHALEYMREEGVYPDIVIVLMANSGVVKKEWVETAITNLLENEELSASAPAKMDQDHHPYRAKKLREDGCLDTWIDFSKETENENFITDNLNDICASIQYTIIEILMDKLKKAVLETGINRIAIGGGVSANSGIRNAMNEAQTKYGWQTYIPKFEYTTDNAAMIGIVGYYNFLEENFSTSDVVSKARIEF